MPSRLGLRELRAAARPGECPFCGDPIKRPHRKYFKYCGDPVCLQAYRRYDQRDRRESARRAVTSRVYRPSRGPVDKLVLYSETLECGHIRLYKQNGGKHSETRLCRECLTSRTKQLR